MTVHNFRNSGKIQSFNGIFIPLAALFLYHSLQAQLKNTNFIEFNGRRDKRKTGLQLISILHRAAFFTQFSGHYYVVLHKMISKVAFFFFPMLKTELRSAIFPEGDGIWNSLSRASEERSHDVRLRYGRYVHCLDNGSE